MRRCTCKNGPPGKGGRHEPACPRHLAGTSGPSVPYRDRRSNGNPLIRVPEPLRTEVRRAIDEGWPDEAAEILRDARANRSVVQRGGKDPQP